MACIDLSVAYTQNVLCRSICNADGIVLTHISTQRQITRFAPRGDLAGRPPYGGPVDSCRSSSSSLDSSLNFFTKFVLEQVTMAQVHLSFIFLLHEDHDDQDHYGQMIRPMVAVVLCLAWGPVLSFVRSQYVLVAHAPQTQLPRTRLLRCFYLPWGWLASSLSHSSCLLGSNGDVKDY